MLIRCLIITSRYDKATDFLGNEDSLKILQECCTIQLLCEWQV